MSNILSKTLTKIVSKLFPYKDAPNFRMVLTSVESSVLASVVVGMMLMNTPLRGLDLFFYFAYALGFGLIIGAVLAHTLYTLIYLPEKK